MMPQGPWGLVCSRHPVYPPDMPIGPILVSGWTGWVDGSTLHPKITASKAWNISRGGIICQLPLFHPTGYRTSSGA